jgi:7-cyano-7-deazaguanine synthase
MVVVKEKFGNACGTPRVNAHHESFPESRIDAESTHQAAQSLARLKTDLDSVSDPSHRDRVHRAEVIGVLASGGLDSCILIKCLLDANRRVKPFYIRSGLYWQTQEEQALNRYLDAVVVRQLEPLTVLELPLADLYGDHWSITGRNVPLAGTPDEAVYLPGRNALLAIKAALWCQMHNVGVFAVATLESNPFEDASASYFHHLRLAISAMRSRPFRLTRPFAGLAKQQVMELGLHFPLHLTFSCIAPRRGLHCGRCNKCAERQAAFRLSGIKDLTHYAMVEGHSSSVVKKSRKNLQEINQ